MPGRPYGRPGFGQFIQSEFILKHIFIFLIGLFWCSIASAQTFTFECVCAHLSGDTCDICPTNPALDSRSFHGLLIRRNGTAYKWIDEPYTIKRYKNESIEFLEMIPTPDKITIARFQTPFTTMQGFVDSTTCFCSLGGAMDTVVVDTPIIGNGTIANPLTIGQFGADTTMFLNWNGHHWFPANVQWTDLEINLPYFKSDTAAMSAGLMVGDPYLLECDNDYSLPSGIFKVVKICGYDCAFTLKFYSSDAVALANGIPIGREYATNQVNVFGILYGFVKSIATNTLTNDSLVCNTTLPNYDNDADGITGGLVVGDPYNMTASNTYGAPAGMNRVVSTPGSSSADAPVCCDVDATLPYYDNDATAITGGLATGIYYYLSSTNTLGFPYGAKKRIQ